MLIIFGGLGIFEFNLGKREYASICMVKTYTISWKIINNIAIKWTILIEGEKGKLNNSIHLSIKP